MADVQLTWLGHGTFRFDTPGGKRVYLDPYLDNPKCPESEKDPERIDILALTHGHNDHVGSSVDLINRFKPTVVGIIELLNWLAAASAALLLIAARLVYLAVAERVWGMSRIFHDGSAGVLLTVVVVCFLAGFFLLPLAGADPLGWCCGTGWPGGSDRQTRQSGTETIFWPWKVTTSIDFT